MRSRTQPWKRVCCGFLKVGEPLTRPKVGQAKNNIWPTLTKLCYCIWGERERECGRLLDLRELVRRYVRPCAAGFHHQGCLWRGAPPTTPRFLPYRSAFDICAPFHHSGDSGFNHDVQIVFPSKLCVIYRGSGWNWRAALLSVRRFSAA